MTASRLLADAVVGTTAVVVLAWVGSAVLRRSSAALRHSIWRAALAAFWVVPLTAVAVDALHLQICPVPLRQAAMPEGHPGAQAAPGIRVGASWEIPYGATGGAARTRARRATTMTQTSPLTAALLLWSAGAMLGVAYLLWDLRGVRDLTRAAGFIRDPSLLRRVTEWCDRVGSPRVPALAESPAIRVPTIVGWRRPVLLLPADLSPDDASCDGVLVHELAHISRGDLAAQAAARATRALWWWHPLAWLTERELRISAEEACDDWAVALTEQRQRYASHLVRWAEAAKASGVLAYACGGRGLVRRVRRILEGAGRPALRPSRRALTVLGACTVAAVFAGSVLRAQPAPERTRSSPERGNTMTGETPAIQGELKREGDRVWIEGLEKARWGGGLAGRAAPQNSYLAALTYALQAMGEEITYDYVMGVSGAAFRLQMGYPEWCPTAPMAPFGFDCTVPAREALGRTLTEFVAESGDSREAEQAREMASESIDKGNPALFIRFGWEWEIVAGYEGEEKTLLLRDYGADHDGYSQMQKRPDGFAVTVIGDEQRHPPRREALLRSLGIAVTVANTERHTGVPAGAYVSGFAAYEYWINGLLDDGKWERLGGEELAAPVHANAHCYNSLIDARQSAEKYLRAMSGELGGESGDHLSKAADFYGEVHRRLTEGWKHVVLPGSLKQGESWPRERRQAEADVLREALALERRAVGELEAALAAEGMDASQAASLVGPPPGSDGPAEHVLADVPRLGFEKGELTLVGSVTACLQFLGEDVTYHSVMAASGGAFKLFFHPTWCPSSGDLQVAGDAPLDHLFSTLGYRYERIPKEETPENETLLRGKIVSTLLRGRPVIAAGIVGPPECGVVTGYEEHGEVLRGWSYFTDSSEGYYRKADWYGDCWGLILIGDKTRTPSTRETLRHVLEWAVDLARRPERNGYASGLAAYDVWANALRRDEDFPRGDLEALTSKCLVHANVVLSVLADARRSAVAYLKGAAGERQPGGAEIADAVACYEDEIRILDQAMKLSPFTFGPEEERLKMADPGLRGRLAEMVVAAREKDKQAVEHLERAIPALSSA